MPWACSLLAEAISPMRLLTLLAAAVISLSVLPTSALMATPLRAWLTDSSMRAAVFLAASAERMARLRTSSATTAKPLPASPARAASTAAFNASKFVWNAISSITLMILAVWAADFSMSEIAADIRCIAWLPRSAACCASEEMALACAAVSALFRVMEDISSMALVVSSSAAACSEAFCASFWLLAATRSAISVDCCTPVARTSAIRLIGREMPRVMKKPNAPSANTASPETTPVNCARRRPSKPLTFSTPARLTVSGIEKPTVQFQPSNLCEYIQLVPPSWV